MFRRILVENWQTVLTLVSFAIFGAVFLGGMWRAENRSRVFAQERREEAELVTLLAATERDAARFASQLNLGGKQEKRKPGGQVGAVYAPDRAAAPPKLRMLRDSG